MAKSTLPYQVTIPWPRPPQFENTDPNEVLRPWLEQHVGKQGIDWEWDVWIGEYGISDGLIVWFNDENLAIQFKLIAS